MWLADLFGSARDRRFFDLLNRQAALLSQAARALAEYVDGGSPELADTVARLEGEGDLILQELLGCIRDTFVTPLDRQDLYNLGEALDDMLDYLKSAALEFKLFAVPATQAAREMCGVLAEAAHEAEAAVNAIANDAAAACDHARVACDAENRVESLYRSALAQLFDGEDMRFIFKTREIYRHLSNSADRADVIGKLIGKIVVKRL